MANSQQAKLPLRLQAEPHVKAAFRDAFVLPSTQEEKLCLVVDDRGLIALVLHHPPMSIKEVTTLLELPDSSAAIPSFALVINDDGKARWADVTDPALPTVRAPKTIESNERVTPAVACIITKAIHRYYERQVLEPSIRGFLSILEKQFPRNDLYLFELLQNAVDDGAMHVKFTVQKTGGRSSEEGLFFLHNGRGFTALDCLGLASVGLSTKSKSERTIGFMGVGFKAVYKRYAKVTVYDDTFCFRFEEPDKPAPMEPSHGWVLKPKWVNSDRLWDGPNTSSQGGASKTGNWCHFQLERPRGGIQVVESDLRVLPTTIPALLGRQALKNFSFRHPSESMIGQQWILEWADTSHAASRNATADFRCAFEPKLWTGSGECIVVDQSHSSSSSSSSLSRGSNRHTQSHGSNPINRHCWQFISVQFIPDQRAREAYETHTKRAWGGGNPSTATEETSLFFEVTEDGSPEVQGLVHPTSSNTSGGSSGSFRNGSISKLQNGYIHSVLPTKLQLPCPIQWQASWLLSVDRQEVQSVSDNDWNKCMLEQAPRLWASVMAWAAHTKPSNLRAVYALFPPMHHSGSAGIVLSGHTSSSSSSLSTTLLGVKIALDVLVRAVNNENIVPVIRCSTDKPVGRTSSSTSSTHPTSSSSLDFVRSRDAIWLPPPLLQRIPSSLLVLLFPTAHPLATTLLGNSYPPPPSLPSRFMLLQQLH